MDNSVKKLLLFPVLIIVLLALWLKFFYIPKNQEAQVQYKKLVQLRTKIRQFASEQEIRRLQTKVDSLSKYCEVQEKRLFTLEKMADLGAVILDNGKTFGLRLISVTPDYSSLSELHKNQESISELPVTIEYDGYFRQFTQFIDAIPTLPFALKVSGVMIIPKTLTTSELNIKLQGVVVLRKERENGTIESENKITKNRI